jgi:hypothetical protein
MRGNDHQTLSPTETAAEQQQGDACDEATAWQRWLFEAALGSIPAPVHLPRCLLRRLWARTVADDTTASHAR